MTKEDWKYSDAHLKSLAENMSLIEDAKAAGYLDNDAERLTDDLAREAASFGGWINSFTELRAYLINSAGGCAVDSGWSSPTSSYPDDMGGGQSGSGGVVH